MITDVIHLAIQTAQAVRLVLAAIKGESKVVLSARRLMHSCSLYEECLRTLLTAITEKLRVNSSNDLENQLNSIVTQIDLDRQLLKEIQDESNKILETTKNYSVLINSLISIKSKRVDKIKDLEAQLLQRISVITSFMMKDLWTASNGVDNTIVETINDSDGYLFWIGHFESKHEVTFGLFLDSYQAYLSDSFYFRKLIKTNLILLLRHTLLDERGDESSITGSIVTLQMFSTWLKRYGPMKDTLYKCAAVTIPSKNATVPWFYKSLTGESADKIISENMAEIKRTGVINPSSLIILRYSTSGGANNHFVVTARPPSFQSTRHYRIQNSDLGYSIEGEERSYYSTIIECIQETIFNPIFSRCYAKEIVLPTTSLDQWNELFKQAMLEFSKNVYATAEDLRREANEITEIEQFDNVTVKKSATFQSMFNFSINAVGSIQNIISSNSSSKSASSSETSIIGNYLVRHGLQMLLEDGSINEQKVKQIMSILSTNS